MNNKIVDLSKLKAFAEDKINVIEKLKFVFRWVENIVGTGEYAGYKHFLLFPQGCLKSSRSWSLKSRGCVVKTSLFTILQNFRPGQFEKLYR